MWIYLTRAQCHYLIIQFFLAKLIISVDGTHREIAILDDSLLLCYERSVSVFDCIPITFPFTKKPGHPLEPLYMKESVSYQNKCREREVSLI
ncbi:MAG: hypothetical protein ACFFDT_32190 [Candidatus Hodarchaeota archaeon]